MKNSTIKFRVCRISHNDDLGPTWYQPNHTVSYLLFFLNLNCKKMIWYLMLLFCLRLQFINIQKSSGKEKVKCDVKILESYCTQVLLWDQYLIVISITSLTAASCTCSRSAVILGTKLEVSASISTEVFFLLLGSRSFLSQNPGTWSYFKWFLNFVNCFIKWKNAEKIVFHQIW